MENISALSDRELSRRLERYSRTEQKSHYQVIKHLAEVDRRKLYLALGYSSLYEYAVKHLKYSEAAAVRRIRTARAAAALPEVCELLESGDVSMSAIETCSKLLISSNGALVLNELKGKSKSDAQAMVLASQPRKEIKDRIEPVFSFVPVGQLTIENSAPKNLTNSLRNRCDGNGSGEEQASDSRFRISFAAGKEFMEKLTRAQEISFRGQRSDVQLENIFGEALELFLDKNCPKRRNERRNKREAKVNSISKPESRQIPKPLSDRILERDGHCCSFVGESGVRCSCKYDLEIDHIVPFALGGETIPENLRVLCRQHNAHEARRVFGNVRKYDVRESA